MALEEASAAVVGILAHTGGEMISSCSGFVIESSSRDGKFVSSILTSASILSAPFFLRCHRHRNEVRKDVEISVILAADGGICNGTISAYNFHFNIGVIEIITDFPVEMARLRFVEDSFSISPNNLDENPLEYDNESGKFNLVSGRTVIALGRYHEEGNKLMVIAGEFSAEAIELDCKELYRANLEISEHGTGGPLMNTHGEVIGINFYYHGFTPFLPINIASMWWEQWKKKGTCLVPNLGMLVNNLCMNGTHYLEIVTQRAPNIVKGVAIREITSESLVLAGILQDDVIFKCDEQPVGSILELFQLIWNKVGKPVNLAVWRPNGSYLAAAVTFDEVETHQIYRWNWIKMGRMSSRRGVQLF